MTQSAERVPLCQSLGVQAMANHGATVPRSLEGPPSDRDLTLAEAQAILEQLAAGLREMTGVAIN